MGSFKKPKRKLGKFLKETKSAHNRKGLMKLGFGLVSGAVAVNVLLSATAFAHTNTLSVNQPHNNTPFLQQDPVPGTQCWKLVGAHTSVAHTNTPHNSVY